MKIRLILMTIALFLVMSSSLPAQVATSSVRGTVSDSNGAAIVGASVELSRKETGFDATRVTGKDGDYQFQQVPPGKYELTVRDSGFNTEVEEAELLIAQPSTLNVALAVESQSASVEVQGGAAETLNTTNASIGNAVDESTVAALPMEGRNVTDLLSLQPGVLYLGHVNTNLASDSRSGAVAGARSDQGNITLDGLDNNDQVNGYAFQGVLRPTIDSVQEFRVTTSNNGADSGRSSGAQVNVLTKSGTNALHGSLYEYNRNTATAANNWFNKEAEALNGEANKPGELIRNTFGAAIGGPAKKDKLYYFLNFEMQRTAEAQQSTLIVPNAAFRAGYLSYENVSGGETTLTPAQFASTDPHCFALGTCPWGPGDNPNILKLFNSYPLPNGNLAGDGYNTASYTWAAPNPINLWTNIARIDYNLSSRHSLFVRGNLQDDSNSGIPQFPGQPPSNLNRDNTKGIAAGDIWTINQSLVNNLRFGYTRQGFSNRAPGAAGYIALASVSDPVSENYSTITDVPVTNLVDDLSWLKRRHNFQFGLDYRLIHDNSSTDNGTFNSAQSATGEVGDTLANTGQDLDASAFGFPAINSDFIQSYSYAAMNLAGVVATTYLNYEYKVTSKTQATLLPEGSYIDRDFKANQFEYYLQDTYQVTPKLAITYGIRHSLNQTPYEVNGQQVSPNISLSQWFANRVAAASQGESVQPDFSYVPSGKANGGLPLWKMAKADIAPRVGVAYALDAKTSIRAGGGLNYDNFGLSIANMMATYGSSGLSGQEQTAAGYTTTQAAPRFTGLTNIPIAASGLPAPSGSVNFPFLPPIGAETQLSFTADDGVKTPHSFQADFSVQRLLPGGFTLETDYVGRFGRRTLQNRDLGMPLDLVDPQSGSDYFTAADTLEKEIYSGINVTSVGKIPYFENLFPDAAGLGASGTGTPGYTATQNIFNNYAVAPLNAAFGLYNMDVNCTPGCGGKTNRYFASQFDSLPTLSSIGTTSYNSAQVILRHPMHQGLQADFSYTFSKSIDLGSDAERGANTNYLPGSYTGYNSFSQIVNAFNPKLNRAVSDYDVRHLLTADWVYLLPFGHSRRYIHDGNSVLEALADGWQLTGLARLTSGLPFGDQIGSGWTTAWNYQSFLVKQGPVALHKHIIPGEGPEVFADPAALEANVNQPGSPIRYPLPGEVGTRNAFRGDGYFGIDSGLNKSFEVRDGVSLKFAWEVFNLTNSVRFDVNPNTSLQSVFGNGDFGVYSNTLTQARVQQFSLRASF